MARSVLTADQFTKNELIHLLNLSSRVEKTLTKKRQIPLLNEYILATLFFEPSTRTRLSFESAMHRLGGRVITSVGMQFSSLSKGETLYDTLKMVESYADICVIRHPMEGASQIAAKNISIPVINGGDGASQHPTQGLLDLYTIHKYKNLMQEKITIAFVGDIKYGRTIHSLIQYMGHFNAEFIFISPNELKLPEKYVNYLQKKRIPFTETEDINYLKNADVGYITRVQEERFIDHKEFEKFKDFYVVNSELLEKCREDIIIMHPLPRLNEISTDVDDKPQAKYFEQAKNGLYMRMSLLIDLLGVPYENIIDD